MTYDIFVSDKLKSILFKIKDISRVAELMLRITHPIDILHDEPVNYISVSESDPTKISYQTKDRIECMSSEFDVWTHKRLFARPGSVVNKIFKDVFTSKDIEVFNNLYKSALSLVKFDFKIVNGYDIIKYYHGNNYDGCSGSLGNSCMKYDNCQKFLHLYAENPNIVSMLVMTNPDNRVIGRALLWEFNDQKVMDRIYTNNDEELPYHFKKWASDNNFIYKHEQRWNNTLWFEDGGKRVYKEFKIKLDNWKFDYYPYMDTFKFFDRGTGFIYNYIPADVMYKTISAADGSQLNPDYLAKDFVTDLFH